MLRFYWHIASSRIIKWTMHEGDEHQGKDNVYVYDCKKLVSLCYGPCIMVWVSDEVLRHFLQYSGNITPGN